MHPLTAIDAFKVCVIWFLWLQSTVLSVESTTKGETAEALLNLFNFALQSRRTHSHYPYPYSFKYPGKYPEYYQKYPLNPYQYPGSSYPSFQHTNKYPYKLPNEVHNSYKPPNSYGYPSDSDDKYHGVNPFAKPKESIMDVLYSIARNDDLQCVPKLICEVTSGTISGRQQGLNLPINVNMESLLGFLSILNGAQSSPILYFGKAALLGYTSKGNTGTCNYAYPECPSDPEKVVKYLNNHNGGFFRFFNGAVGTQIPHWRKPLGEKRIQNNAVDYIPNNYKYQGGISFPHAEGYPNFEGDHSFRAEKNLRFPTTDYAVNELYENTNDYSLNSYNSLKFPNTNNYEEPYRKPKELYYHDDYNFDLQRPLVNHKPAKMIFPVRTGTGDLRLDPEELQDYRRPVSYQDDDVRIIFNSGSEGHRESYNRYGKGFSFPQK